jgi:hypothetical protein
MGSFLTGIAAAILLALITGFGLNSWNLSAKTVFSTEETRL